jgi:hypothetical protein
MALGVLTRDDLIRAGACSEGVDVWICRNAPKQTAVTVAVAIERSDGESRDWILRAAELDGYGDGYGDGDGDGSGSGSGYGSGYGYGYGYGYGDGYGYGYGYGYGDGSGSGYGYGYDSGYGYGDG